MACGKTTCAIHYSDHSSGGSDRTDPDHVGWSLNRVWVVLSLWTSRHRQRRALAQLDTRLLRDIGVTRAQAEREVRKPF